MLTDEARVEREAQARKLFGQGMSVNAVAKECFKNCWASAKAVKDAMDGIAPKADRKAAKKAPKHRGATAAVEVEAAEAEVQIEDWDVTLRVQAGGLEQIFAVFTTAEKAQAIQSVMQARLDALTADGLCGN